MYYNRKKNMKKRAAVSPFSACHFSAHLFAKKRRFLLRVIFAYVFSYKRMHFWHYFSFWHCFLARFYKKRFFNINCRLCYSLIHAGNIINSWWSGSIELLMWTDFFLCILPTRRCTKMHKSWYVSHRMYNFM